MLQYLVRLVGSLIFISWVVGSMVFFLIHLVPGDPVEVMLGDWASPADADALRHQLGLDLPLFQQYIHYLTGIVQGDFGQSLFYQQPVSELITNRFPYTLQLALLSLLIAVLIAFPLGIWASIRAGKWPDHLAMSVSLIGVSVPNFWLGPMLILAFSIGLSLLPVSGAEQPFSWVLPAITLGTALAAILARMLRASLLEIYHEDFIRTARAKGLSGAAVYGKHALMNAMLPVITVLGLQLGTLLGGAVITEVVFDWPGLGQLLVESIQRRDYPVVQACILIISVAYILVNGLTEVVYAWLDPRIRLAK
ncbi:nickel ABC transporter permease [Hydrogenovibrio marinus]|uniref:Glutathione ABC transporter permease n=1 Tax=Hydrogenovibrio marinus TaxID=28885 RepID=A0A066ZY21_HYDMR|nr:nickel ABC transporter permease [Hydrogenovibrio marinus]KDN95231.1 glutathione ABC transporter permease [Hydrogenovibrio marinus]BBN59708.1 peptide ABC transporter permease [Hydrogenovibrio marinus]